MSNQTPLIVELTVVTDGYIVKPRTSCYALQFNTVQDISVRFRYREGEPWLNVVQGDFYNFECNPIETGILFDLSSASGPAPSVIVHLATTPRALGTA